MTIQWRFVCLLSSLIAIYACGCAKENPRALTTVDLEASLMGPLPWDPMQGKVITTWMDSGSETMSTLYGNDAAIDHARKSREQCAAGVIVSLVTWKQREDPRWFGAKIPGKVQSVEFCPRRACRQSGNRIFISSIRGSAPERDAGRGWSSSRQARRVSSFANNVGDALSTRSIAANPWPSQKPRHISTFARIEPWPRNVQRSVLAKVPVAVRTFSELLAIPR
jgi:hypothetical protein